MSNQLWLAKQHWEACSANLIPKPLATRISWSQYREDELIVELCGGCTADGYYVDVGANHPVKISNTYRLYRMGYHGITIDPNITMMHLHRLYRSRDCQVCAAVSLNNQVRAFRHAEYHGISHLAGDSERSITFCDTGSVEPVPTLNLTDILDSVQKDSEDFVLLSVDVEGSECEVLRGLDFDRYRPKVIVAEHTNRNNDVIEEMRKRGYKPRFKTECNVIAVDDRTGVI